MEVCSISARTRMQNIRARLAPFSCAWVQMAYPRVRGKALYFSAHSRGVPATPLNSKVPELLFIVSEHVHPACAKHVWWLDQSEGFLDLFFCLKHPRIRQSRHGLKPVTLLGPGRCPREALRRAQCRTGSCDSCGLCARATRFCAAAQPTALRRADAVR